MFRIILFALAYARKKGPMPNLWQVAVDAVVG